MIWDKGLQNTKCKYTSVVRSISKHFFCPCPSPVFVRCADGNSIGVGGGVLLPKVNKRAGYLGHTHFFGFCGFWRGDCIYCLSLDGTETHFSR